MEERHDPARRGLVVAAGAEDLAAMNRPWNPGIRGSAERLRRVNADRLFDGLFALVLVCSGALLLYLARHGTFVADEWTFIGERMTPSLDTWLRPHNEHLSLLPVVAYELLFAAFGLATHLPYTALLILLHMLACAGVYRAITLLSGRSAAFAAATVVLLLGPAFDDLFWAFQIGFVGSTAAGIWAIVLLIAPTRSFGQRVTACVLLILSLASSGIGLTFLCVAMVLLALEARLRRDWPVLVIPSALYLLWFLRYGLAALGSDEGSLSILSFSQVPAFVVTGGGAALKAVTTVPAGAAQAAFVVVAFLLAFRFIRGAHGSSLALAAIIGIVAQFGLIGLVRVEFGADQAAVSRYVYSGAILVVLALGDLLGTARDRLSSMRRLVLPLVAVGVVATNVQPLIDGRNYFAGLAREARAEIALVEADPAHSLPSDRDLFPMPNVGELRRLLHSVGSPLHDRLVPGDPAAASGDEADRAFFRVYRASVVTGAWDGATGRAASINLAQTHGVLVSPAPTGCLNATPFGDDAFVLVTSSDGSGLGVVPGGPGQITLFLARDAAPQPVNSWQVPVEPARPLRIQLPLVGDGRSQMLRLQIPAGGATLVCQLDRS